VAKPAAVHRLELIPPKRGNKRRKEHTRQVVDVTLRTSDRMLLTVAEAAERLGIERSTMYVLIADGQIDTVRVGRLRRIEPEALRAYISRMRTTPTGTPRPESRRHTQRGSPTAWRRAERTMTAAHLRPRLPRLPRR